MAEKKIVDLPVSQTMSDNDSVFVSQNGSPVWVAFSKLKSLIKTFSGSYNDLSDKPSFKTINGNSIVGSGNISITGGTGTNVTVDSALSATSTNPVQNKVINDELNKKLNKSDYTAYSLPTASATVLGGVKPVAKTTAMTQAVGVDANGGLWTAPGASGGSSETYELDAPKLIVDYTVAEIAAGYEFTSENYPELGKCKWLYIQLEYPSVPSDQPWLNFQINDKEVCGFKTTIQHNVMKVYEKNGLWEACGYSNSNASYLNNINGVSWGTPTGITRQYKYSPIKKVKLKSYVNVLLENSTIKIYGYY